MIQKRQQELGMQFFAKKIDWLRMANLSAERYQKSGNIDYWLKTLQLIADATPHDPLANIKIGELLYQQKRYSEAKYYLQRAKRAGTVSAELDRQISFSIENAKLD